MEPVSDNAQAASKPIVRHEASMGRNDQIQYRQAKLWARLDEIEAEQRRQKEKIRIIEKGLVLGLVPQELTLEEAPVEPTIKAEAKTPALPAVDASTEETAALTKIDDESGVEYQRRLGMAQAHYRAGRFGTAIADYEAIEKDFKNAVTDGSCKFWIAMSWGALKENQKSHQAFQEFLTQAPMSSLVPRGKLEMARVEVKMGLREKALDRLKSIMRDHPYEDAAEIAKFEIKKMEQSL
jgi:TolA-binding protein